MIRTANNNSLNMGASGHCQPEDRYNTMSTDIPSVKILRTPLWKITNPNEPYLFFGNIGSAATTYYYRYVVYNTFGGSPEFKELLYNIHNSFVHFYISPNPINRKKIEIEDLKELKKFIKLKRNNGNSSFCTRIFDSLSDININS